MEKPKDNIFTSFRGPSPNRDSGRLGKQLEDNTTKALLHVLDHGDAAIVEAIISALTADTELHSTLAEATSLQEIKTRTQVQIQDIDHQNRNLIFVGVSDSGVDPTQTDDVADVNADDPKTSELRVDGVIHVGDKFTIVEESKFDGGMLELSDTAAYTKTLGIPDSQYHTISWLDIYEKLAAALDSDISPEVGSEDERAQFVAGEFMRYLQIYGLSLSQSESTYNAEDENVKGVNTITLEFRPEMNVRTVKVSDEPVEYAIHFDTVGATGYLDLYLTNNEWSALLDNLEENHPDARDYLQNRDVEGFFEYIENEISPSSREKLAEIGDKEGGRKWIQVVPKEDGPVLGFKYAKPGKQEAPCGYFMLAQGELEDHFGGAPGSEETAFQSLFAENLNIKNLR